MMQSDAVNWSVAILLSLLVHGMILFGKGARIGEQDAIVLQAPIITRLNFNRHSEEVVPDKPRPVEKQQPQPVKKVAVEPVKAKPVRQKPAEKKQVIRQPESSEKIEPVRQAPVQEQMVVQKQVQGRAVSHSSDNLMQQEHQKYLHQLMSHIESFKYYPRSARRRSLEGEVNVSFTILGDGTYKQLSLDGRHSVLVKATRLALESAIPLPVPPRDAALSRQIEFTMSYSLTN
jgi:periplasmic protein TonB